MHALQACGAHVVWSAKPRVITSARTHARATGGFADALCHAVNERLAASYHASRGREIPGSLRLISAALILVGSIFLAGRFGLVTLIARGYRLLAYLILLLYVAPLMTSGLWRVLLGNRRRMLEISAARIAPEGRAAER